MTFLRRSGGWLLWISATETGVNWEGQRRPNWTERYSPIYPDVKTIWDWGGFWCIQSMFDCIVIFRDLISNLAQPTRAWADPIKIPALESWSNEARYYLKNVFIRELRFTKILFRDEIFALFNYIPDQSVVFWRGVQNLNTTKLTNHLSEKGTSNICEVRR